MPLTLFKQCGMYFFFLTFGVLTLSACSGDSGQAVESNVPPDITDRGDTVVYNGPSALSVDVQNFRINVWDNLAREDRCGQCHIEGGDAPMFVRFDDINLAYAEANAIVDLSAPSRSRMVEEVASGHNCWEAVPSVCAAIITNFIENWASDSGASATEIVLTPPVEIEVTDSKSFPSDVNDTNFATTVYPYLSSIGECSDCHAEEADTQQQPYVGSSDIAIAYQAARTRMNIDSPNLSRLVTRLSQESHNCWRDCTSDAEAMENAIAEFATAIPITEFDDSLLASRALALPNGTPASTGGRIDSNVIALYEFKTGMGAVAFDTSGIDPALNLNLVGSVNWLGSFGLNFTGGKAQGATSASTKLHTLIQATGEYAIEAWVVPGNVTQDGPARIVTYSGGDTIRNFTLGQTTYDYDFLSRHSESDQNGMPLLSTPSADEVLQATLQHVVVNYSPIDGRSIYVNGQLISTDTETRGSLEDWDASFALALGQEVDGESTWLGSIRLLAIHNRALTAEQILNNFDAGVGEKFFLLFGVSHLVNVPEAYIIFQVEQFDDYAYLFSAPYFTSLDPSAVITDSIAIQGLRVGVNGREASAGQTYELLDVTIDPSEFALERRYDLSNLGAIVPIEKGSDDDQFFLIFDHIAGVNSSFIRPQIEAEPNLAIINDPQSDIGVRTYDEVNATLSMLTSIAPSTRSVANVFETVRTQLPATASLEAFLASHQSGVMQLTVAYCNALMTDTTLRASIFPGLDFSAPFSTAFANNTAKDLLVQPLLDRLLINNVDSGAQRLNTTVALEVAQSELYSLIDNMSASSIETVSIGICAAAFGNAAMLVQ